MLIRLFTICFVVSLTLSLLNGQLPQFYLWLYLIVSIFTLIIYRQDKIAAKNKQRRTPEMTLHVLALIGGWPGAVLAQRVFHHKSKKNSFQRLLWLTIFLNCVLLAGLTSLAIDQLIQSHWRQCQTITKQKGGLSPPFCTSVRCYSLPLDNKTLALNWISFLALSEAT